MIAESAIPKTQLALRIVSESVKLSCRGDQGCYLVAALDLAHWVRGFNFQGERREDRLLSLRAESALTLQIAAPSVNFSLW